VSPDRLDEMIADFWDRVGGPPPFPRDLEPAIPLAAPVGVVTLGGLRPAAVQRWLLRQGVRLPLRVADRPLDGCIIAYRGQAVLFVNAALAADERRAVLAHEVGHYLRDYEAPRRRALRRLGPSVLPVLDGERPPCAAERLAGALADVPLAPQIHYMDRSFDPGRAAATDHVERLAWDVALELLAPRAAVLAKGRGLSDQPEPWRELLAERFGLPARWASAYAARLLRARGRGRSFSDLLGL
jgi:hypothetical protein